jgi:hypothetical protein
VEGFWRRMRQATIDGHTVCLPSAEDNLFMLALHGRLFGKPLSLKYVLDMALLLKRYQANFNWDAIAKEAARLRLASTVYFLLAGLESIGLYELPVSFVKQLRIPALKRRLIRRFIASQVFSDTIFERAKAIYQKSQLFLFDSPWEPLSYIKNISKPHFARFYNLRVEDKSTDALYRNRFLYIPYRGLGSLLKKEKCR